jgi:hypothetical protein
MTQEGVGKKKRNRSPLKKKRKRSREKIVKILIILYKGGARKNFLTGAGTAASPPTSATASPYLHSSLSL